MAGSISGVLTCGHRGRTHAIFTTLTSKRIAGEIAAARQRVILAAPGVDAEVANALIATHQRLGEGAVQVVLDVSATVCRLGFGDHPAVERLSAAGVTLHQQSGLRLGVLICDARGWGFAKSPRLVEADPGDQGDVCNAIALTEAQILALRSELPATTGHSDAEAPPTNPAIGTSRVEPDAVARITRALDIAPPQSFDLARQTHVYTALLQFVELEFGGFSLQNRRVQLPGSLPVISSKDKALKERVSASLRLLDKMEKPKALRDITAWLEDLRKAYLVPVGRAGRVILKSKLAAFEKELGGIEADLQKCKETLEKDIEKALEVVVESLVPDLARAVLADPPSRFRGLYPMDDASAKDFVRDELRRTFPSARSLVRGMKIYRFYKDAKYQTLKDADFQKKVAELVPESILKGALLEEYTAAKANHSE